MYIHEKPHVITVVGVRATFPLRNTLLRCPGRTSNKRQKTVEDELLRDRLVGVAAKHAGIYKWSNLAQ
eukprot:3823278-Pyramimonas_sp.AAC.2